MSTHYPIVFETEANGAISAYVPGLPVYAAAHSQRRATKVMGDVLRAYLEAHPEATARATIRVAAVSQRDKRVKVRFASIAAMLGSTRSPAKTPAARENGRKGGRLTRVSSARSFGRGAASSDLYRPPCPTLMPSSMSVRTATPVGPLAW
jgi:hypothetical protein